MSKCVYFEFQSSAQVCESTHLENPWALKPFFASKIVFQIFMMFTWIFIVRFQVHLKSLTGEAGDENIGKLVPTYQVLGRSYLHINRPLGKIIRIIQTLRIVQGSSSWCFSHIVT